MTLSSGSIGLWVWENYRAQMSPALVYYWTLLNYYNAQYGSKIATAYMWYVLLTNSKRQLFDTFRLVFYSTQQVVYWYW